MKISDIVQILNEDLGNLKLIDPKFRKIFSNYWNKSKAIGDKHTELGQNSPVEAVEIVKAKDAVDALFTNASVKAVVLIFNGVQVAGIGKDSRDFEVYLDADAVHQMKPEKDVMQKMSDSFRGYRNSGLMTGLERKSLSETKTRSFINTMFKIAKHAGATMSALVIKNDPERFKKRNDRFVAKKGLIPSSGEEIRSDNYNRQIKAALNKRLEAFKVANASKAAHATPEEFMASAIKDGFMDKINVGGFIFELQDDSIRLSSIIKPEGWHKSNAITYRLDSDHNSKLDELNKRVWNLRQKARESETLNPELEAKIAALKASYPPRKIQLILGLKGGAIVPTHVEVEPY